LYLCQHYDNLAEVDKLAAEQKQVESVKIVIQENVDIALQNCVKLETIDNFYYGNVYFLGVVAPSGICIAANPYKNTADFTEIKNVFGKPWKTFLPGILYRIPVVAALWNFIIGEKLPSLAGSLCLNSAFSLDERGLVYLLITKRAYSRRNAYCCLEEVLGEVGYSLFP
jgi:hypothetical protein